MTQQQWRVCAPFPEGVDAMSTREPTRRRFFATVPTLTDREQEVMLLASKGQSNKQIARHLSVAEGTIKTHLHNVYQKTAINNRTSLSAFAIPYRQTS